MPRILKVKNENNVKKNKVGGEMTTYSLNNNNINNLNNNNKIDAFKEDLIKEINEETNTKSKEKNIIVLIYQRTPNNPDAIFDEINIKVDKKGIISIDARKMKTIKNNLVIKNNIKSEDILPNLIKYIKGILLFFKKYNKKGYVSFTQIKAGGSVFKSIFGFQYLRKTYYVDYLEERLLLHFNDREFFEKIRNKFGYSSTSGKDFSNEAVKERVCSRGNDDIKLIAPKLNCNKK